MHIPLVDLKAQYQTIKPEIDSAIQQVVDSTKFIHGELTRKFASDFALFCGAKFGVGTSNGTTAITLALIVKGIKPGDQVITTPATFIATAEAIIEAGAKPIFVDIDEKTSNLDPNLIEKAITKNTKAIMPVHLYGRISGMDEIAEIANKHNLHVIEDAAQAHGAVYKGKKAPIIDTATYSFYPGKTLGAYGDAGAIITNSEQVFEKACMLIDHGRKKGEKYRHEEPGYNFRMDELQAAVLSVKLKYLQEWVDKRRKKAFLYSELLREDIIKQQPSIIKDHGMYVYTIKVNNRDDLHKHLKDNGIEAVIHFPTPLHEQPAFSNLGYKKGDFPIAEKLSAQVISLPLYPEISDEQIKKVADVVNSFAK